MMPVHGISRIWVLLMIAKDLKKFESLHRRTVRVIWYKENPGWMP